MINGAPLFKKQEDSKVWWNIPVISVLGLQRQEDHSESKARESQSEK